MNLKANKGQHENSCEKSIKTENNIYVNFSQHLALDGWFNFWRLIHEKYSELNDKQKSDMRSLAFSYAKMSAYKLKGYCANEEYEFLVSYLTDQKKEDLDRYVELVNNLLSATELRKKSLKQLLKGQQKKSKEKIFDYEVLKMDDSAAKALYWAVSEVAPAYYSYYFVLDSMPNMIERKEAKIKMKKKLSKLLIKWGDNNCKTEKEKRLEELDGEIKRNIQENALLHKEKAKIKHELGLDMAD